MKITFGGYTNRSEVLTNFPVLVVFSNNVGSGFTFADFVTTNGYDLRFGTNATPTTNSLNYEIEWWNTNPIAAPTNIAGCSLWLKADAGTLTNASGAVTNWLDQSGNGFNATNTATPPTLASSSINGRPAVRFGTGLTNYLDTQVNICTGAHTVVFVAVPRAASTVTGYGVEVGYRSNAGKNRGGVHYVKSNWTAASYPCYVDTDGGNNGYYDGIGLYVQDVPYIIALPFQQTTPWSVYKSSAVEGTATATGGYKSDIIGLRLGREVVGGHQFIGDIAEVIVYNRVLSASELDLVNDYLARKYAIVGASSLGGYVWVQVPTIPTDGTGAIWARWGDPANSSQLPCTTNGATWETNYKGVWHFTEASGTRYDKTANKNTASANGTVTKEGGVSYQSDRFYYQNGIDYDEVANSTSMENIQEGDYTVESWFRANSTPPGIPSAWNGAYGIVLKEGTHLGTYTFDNKFSFDHYLAPMVYNGGQSTNTYATGVWHHVVGVVSKTVGFSSLYVDGIKARTNVTFTAGTAALEFNQKPWRFGTAVTTNTSYAWPADGNIDEVRLSSSSRSADWIWASYLNQGSNTVFNNYGAMEKQAGPKGTVIMMR